MIDAPHMKQIDRRIRRDAIKLVGIGISLVFMIGFAVGAVVMYHLIDQVIVVALSEGVNVSREVASGVQ